MFILHHCSHTLSYYCCNNSRSLNKPFVATPCYKIFRLSYSFHKKIIQPPAIFSATHSRAKPELDKENDEFLRQYITVGSGILMGMGGVYCREPPMPHLSIVVRNA